MQTAESFVALVIYPSTPDVQAGQADTMLRMVESTIQSMPGFIVGRVFLSEDGESVVTLTEWRDRESFVQFRQSEFGRAAAHVASELHPRAHWLRSYATVGAP